MTNLEQNEEEKNLTEEPVSEPSDLEIEKEAEHTEEPKSEEKQVGTDSEEITTEEQETEDQVESAEEEAPVAHTEEDVDPDIKEEEVLGTDEVEENVTAEIEEPKEEAEQDLNGDDSSEVEEGDAVTYYEDILKKAEAFVSQDDWAFVSNELANLALKIEEGPESSDDAIGDLVNSFITIREEFEVRKRAYYEELNKKKEANLVLKKELLKEFSDIINEQKWTATKEVNQIRGKWDTIKPIPQSEVDSLNERFETLIAEFESHKVDRLVKKLQKEEENFTLKLVLLEKMDALNSKADAEGANFGELNVEFQDLLGQWRKVGRVPAEKNQQAWDHYNAAQDTFNKLRFKHDKEYRLGIEKALEKKQKLIKEAESLIDNDDLAEAARKVNKLHKAWKKTGNLPQKEENELWDKFKAATDSFNEKKTENIEVLREQETKNYDAKLKLIEKAIELQSVEKYDEGHQAMQNLMEEWKKVGPVPRKKSSKVWKDFKDAMDVFYNNRREHFKDIRKEQKQNLALKNEILTKLKELTETDDAADAVQKAKELQNEFKKVGHVPLKFKNKIWKEYREVCDLIYGNYRTSGANSGMERKLAKEGVEPAARKEIIQLQKELENLRKDTSRLESEMIQYEEAKTYFKPTSKGNKLRDELQSKVDAAVEKIALNKRRIKEIVKKINDLKADSSEQE